MLFLTIPNLITRIVFATSIATQQVVIKDLEQGITAFIKPFNTNSIKKVLAYKKPKSIHKTRIKAVSREAKFEIRYTIHFDGVIVSGLSATKSSDDWCLESVEATSTDYHLPFDCSYGMTREEVQKRLKTKFTYKNNGFEFVESMEDNLGFKFTDNKLVRVLWFFPF